MTGIQGRGGVSTVPDALRATERPAPTRPFTLAVIAAGAGALAFLVYHLSAPPTVFNQYVYLTDAVLDGRLAIIDAPPWLELARFGREGYVIDPPGPILFLLAPVALWGLAVDQALVSAVVGGAAVGLFAVFALRRWPSRPFALAMVVLMGIGTNFWWAAADGALWTYAHTCAVFFLSAALVELSGAKRPWLIGVLVGLAGLCRLPVFLAFPFFAFSIADWRLDRRAAARLAWFGGFVGIAALGYLGYNVLRFGTWQDLGWFHAHYFDQPWFSRGRFDVTYVPRHLFAIFLKPPLQTDGVPFLRPSIFGLALFLTTPAFLYAFAARRSRETLAAIASIALVAVPVLGYGMTGWSQFGYRFSLDVLPFLLILSAAGMRERLTLRNGAAIGLSVLVNLWGVLSFFRFGWAAS